LERVRREVEPATMRAFELVMQDRTPAEAAQELGVAVKAVYNAKYTVLKRLRDLRADLENLA
jgi:DNA-directed RNA polymerase specialized sigma24 family protein